MLVSTIYESYLHFKFGGVCPQASDTHIPFLLRL